MRDDAVLGRALPLDRGLGPFSITNTKFVRYSQYANFADSVGCPKAKKLSASWGFALLTPLPLDPTRALPPNSHYRLALQALAMGPLTRILLLMPLTSGEWAKRQRGEISCYPLTATFNT